MKRDLLKQGVMVVQVRDFFTAWTEIQPGNLTSCYYCIKRFWMQIH